MKNIRNCVTSALGRTMTLSQETSIAGLSTVQAQQPIPLPPSSQGPADPLPQKRVVETYMAQIKCHNNDDISLPEKRGPDRLSGCKNKPCKCLPAGQIAIKDIVTNSLVLS
ncbi:hypothetical protein BDC45DRAFT_537415 [Circinella umbellata]|nr:hypothetical protein BDC45DRAFT_537415 [Circinella umbellata]